MHVPLGETIAFNDPTAMAYLDDAWHAPKDGIVRMAQRRATLRMCIVNGSASRHVLTLRLAGLKHPALRTCALRVNVGDKGFAVLDATADREVSLLLPPNAVAASGKLELTFATNNLLAGTTGEGVGAVGPGLVSFSVERLSRPAARPCFSPGSIYSFASGGSGIIFRQAGWFQADASGSVSGEVAANVSGVFFTPNRYVFVSAVVYPAFKAPEDSPQQVTIAANGTPVAAYDVDDRAELTAIVPVDLIGPDHVLDVEFRVSNLVRPADLGIAEGNTPMGIGLALLKVE